MLFTCIFICMHIFTKNLQQQQPFITLINISIAMHAEFSVQRVMLCKKDFTEPFYNKLSSPLC